MTLSKHKRFFVVLLMYLGAVLILQHTLPVLEGPDELPHIGYLLSLQAEKQLPDRLAPFTIPARQEAGQPPLAYWMATSLLDLLHAPPYYGNPLHELDDVRNNWPVLWSRRSDNINDYVHGVDEQAFGHPQIAYADHVGRLLSLLYGLLAVIGAYLAAREVFPGKEAWILIATAIFAFTPEMLYLGTIFSNDTPATAFATLAIWQLLHLLRSGTTRRGCLLLGLFTALAMLSKVSTAILLPGIIVALLVEKVYREQPLRQVAFNGLLILLPILVLFGPWAVYGEITYGDPFGLASHWLYNGYTPAPTLWALLGTLPQSYLSYWGKLGTNLGWVNPASYALYTGILVLSLIGYGLYFRQVGIKSLLNQRRLPSIQTRQAVVMLTLIGANVVLFFYWMYTLFAVNFAIVGRLIYPVHIAIAILLAAGLAFLAQHLKPVQGWFLRASVLGVMASGMIITPDAIHAVYGLPQLLTRDQLPALQGGPLDFEKTIRFLGYKEASPILHLGEIHMITLCWEVLKTTTQPGIYFLKIFENGKNIVGERTSIPGLGRYNSTQWKPGDIFCDDVNVQINAQLDPGQTYDLVVGIVGWAATSANGIRVDTPVVGQLASAAGDMSASVQVDWQPTTIDFAGFADLVGVHFDQPPMPGKTLQLDLLWKVLGRTPDNWSQFIHLIGPNTAIVLADKVPRGGHYPTWAWSPGESIVDQWQVTIPGDLKPGSYQIKLGFYRQDTGDRMPASLAGTPVPDSAVPITTFQVP